METPEMLIHVHLFWVSLMRGAGRHMARTGRHLGACRVVVHRGTKFVGNRGILKWEIGRR